MDILIFVQGFSFNVPKCICVGTYIINNKFCGTNIFFYDTRFKSKMGGILSVERLINLHIVYYGSKSTNFRCSLI